MRILKIDFFSCATHRFISPAIIKSCRGNTAVSHEIFHSGNVHILFKETSGKGSTQIMSGYGLESGGISSASLLYFFTMSPTVHGFSGRSTIR